MKSSKNPLYTTCLALDHREMQFHDLIGAISVEEPDFLFFFIAIGCKEAKNRDKCWTYKMTRWPETQLQMNNNATL